MRSAGDAAQLVSGFCVAAGVFLHQPSLLEAKLVVEREIIREKEPRIFHHAQIAQHLEMLADVLDRRIVKILDGRHDLVSCVFLGKYDRARGFHERVVFRRAVRIRISHNRNLDAFFPEFIIFGGLESVLLKIRLSAENFKGVERMGFKQIIDECLRHLKNI